MKYILLVTILFLSSCESKKDKIVNRQQAIQKEMEQVKTLYFKQVDSLDNVKQADTSAAKQTQIAEAFVSVEKKKNSMLIPLQKEYDSLDVELKKQ